MKITRRNIAQHELIGLHVEVIESSDKGLIGVYGRVVDETKNMLIIEPDIAANEHKNKRKASARKTEKMIPKKYTKFRFTTPANEKIEVNGSVLLYRPEDRVKKGERYGKGKN